MPPKPSRKAVKMIFKEIFLSLTKEIILIPFVISNIPLNIEDIISEGILKVLHIGENTVQIKFVIPLTFKIDIITENKTTKPPIIRMVEIED